jgi:hypothetical protein
MHPLAKALIGVLIVVLSVAYIAVGIPGLVKPAWQDVLTVLNGGLPLLFILIGIFIAWLEWDEWKIERELAMEEKKLEEERKRRKRK